MEAKDILQTVVSGAAILTSFMVYMRFMKMATEKARREGAEEEQKKKMVSDLNNLGTTLTKVKSDLYDKIESLEDRVKDGDTRVSLIEGEIVQLLKHLGDNQEELKGSFKDLNKLMLDHLNGHSKG